LPSLHDPHLVAVQLLGQPQLHVRHDLADQLLDARLFFEGKPLFEVDPASQGSPYLVVFLLVFLQQIFLKIFPDFQQYFIAGSDGVIEI
jgi:hypothetical protein